jgi:phenylpropionate dioxygenase-like ring-hydroxylating dioxygenase large terminal subunit
MFIRNCWYVAAWSEEIGHEKATARTIIGERIVLFRNARGTISAMEDRCAHRRMPLSPGRITGDGKLICPYHGLTYDGEGVCVLVPGQPSPGDIRLRTYPVEERSRLVWVWMGLPAQADASNIFDCSWLERAGWQQTRLYRHAKANYLLLNDNLADLLHVAYLHIPSGGGNEAMGPAETELKVDGFGYHFVRQTRDIPAPISYGRLSNARTNIDRWHIVDFKGPSFFRIYTGVAETGSGGPDSKLPQGHGKWTIAPHHFVTPETEKTTHYFQVVGHEWQPSSDSWRFLNSVIDEDVWAIEQQQRNIDACPEAPNHAIESDKAMFAMRKIVDGMLAAEAGKA